MNTSRLRHPQVIDDLFLYRLSRLQARAGAHVVRLCQSRHGISRREWRIVVVLAQKGPARSSALADMADLDRARTSRAVTGLLEKGLVRRDVRPADRREAVISLTEAGRAVYDALFPEVVAINRWLLAALSDDELAGLDQTMQHLFERAASPPPDRCP